MRPDWSTQGVLARTTERPCFKRKRVHMYMCLTVVCVCMYIHEGQKRTECWVADSTTLHLAPPRQDLSAAYILG